MSKQTVRWGILGPGHIAYKFAQGLAFVKNARLVAVGSRDEKRAKAFAEKYGLSRAYGSYQQLAADFEVDIVYIATPHGRHYEDMLLCLENGKAVLCEKAFTLNADQARKVVALAREKGLFLMEAMWSRFLPVMQKARQLVEEGEIGEPQMLTAHLGFRPEFDPQSRLFNPELGGGALLDIGVYPVSFTHWYWGVPQKITTEAVIGSTGVDEQESIILQYSKGRQAVLFATLRSFTPGDALIMGSEGYLRIRGPLFRPERLILVRKGKEKTIQVPFEGNGYNYEAQEAVNCILQGKTESLQMPLEHTLQVMEIMDAIRKQWKMRYPQEI